MLKHRHKLKFPAVLARTRTRHHITMFAQYQRTILPSLLLLMLTKLSMGSPFLLEPTCPICEPRYCPSSVEDCPRGVVRDACDCCPVGVCLLTAGDRCLDATHIPAISLTDLRVYASCGNTMKCQLRADLDPQRNTKESICMCLETTPVCGSNNVTYSSPCDLHAVHGARLSHTGPCAAAPHVTVGPISTTADLDRTIALGCEVYGVPVPSVIWQFEGFDGSSKFLPGDDTSMVVQSRGGPDSSMVTSWMQIVSARIADSGMYTCVASNENGEVKSAARVIVNAI